MAEQINIARRDRQSGQITVNAAAMMPKVIESQLGGAPLPVSPARENDISIFTALEQQLGLKLESANGPVEVLVIDSVSKPSEN
jgi:uncharacterized protein (TIGR03435 family)